MGSKLRVLPKVPTTGLWVLCVAAGALHGVIGAWVVYWSRNVYSPSAAMFSMFGLFRWVLILLAGFCVSAWVAGRVVGRVHQRFGASILCALLYGVACVIGVFVVSAKLNPSMLLAPWMLPSVGLAAIGIAIAAVMYGGLLAVIVGGVVLVGFLTERFFGRRVVVQSGLICWACGYNVGAATITTCPECGAEFYPDRFPGNDSLNLLGMLTRLRRPALVVAVLLGGIPLLLSLVNHTIPCARFLSSHPAGTELREVWNMQRFASEALSTGWWIPDASNSDTGISVQFVPGSDREARRVIVSRACLVDPTAAGTGMPRAQWWAGAGSVSVHARLLGGQAEQVIRTGAIPTALLDALHAEAEKAGWAIAGIAAPGGADCVVDPSPFFPAATP